MGRSGELARNAGDPEQIIWFLAAIPHSVASGHNPFYTDYAFYPDGANLMWNCALFVPSLLLAPVTAVWGPVTSYNLLLVAGPVATSVAAYLPIRRYVEKSLAAAVGALLFGFSPFVMHHALAGHLHMSSAALLPILLLLLDDIAVRQRWPARRAGAALGLVAVVQLLTAEEILAIGGLSAMVVLGALAAMYPRRIRARLGYLGRAGATAAVVFIPLAAYPLWVQLAGRRRAPGPHATNVYVGDLAGLIRPVGALISLGGSTPFSGNAGESTTYLGVPLLVVVVAVAVTCWRRAVVRVAVVVTVVMSVLALGERLHVDGHDTGIPLPWALFGQIPLVAEVLPARISVAVALATAILAAVFLDRLAARCRPVLVVLGAVVLAATVATFVPGPAPTTTIAAPAFFSSDAIRRAVPAGSVVVVLPFTVDPATEPPMLWQAVSGLRFKMVGGRLLVPHPSPAGNPLFGVVNDQHPGRGPAVTPRRRAQVMTYLRSVHARVVIIGPMPGRDHVEQTLTEVFDRPADLDDGGVALWRVLPIRR